MIVFSAGCRRLRPPGSGPWRLALAALLCCAAPGFRAGGREAAESAPPGIADPLEPVNRVVFTVNDRLYFWCLKPVARGYKALTPERGRIWIQNFFRNVATPARLVNCVFQGKFRGAATELSRFVINTTVGVAGFGDPARTRWGLRPRPEDFGQTLAVYGIGTGPYLELPILGPSSLRDALGRVADFFLDPIHYLRVNPWERMGIRAYDRLNTTSLHLGEYEQLKAAALDPYVALRDAYAQHRAREVRH